VPFRGYERSQEWLLPPSLSEMIGEDHPVRLVAEIADTVDLKALGIATAAPVEGAPAYHPRLLLGLWVYGFMRRERSSRQIERACWENVTYMWLAGLQRPDHVTLARFYQHNRSAMRRLFKETVRLAVGVGLVDFALQAIDGSRIASARRDSLLDEAQLAALLAEVEAEIAALEQAESQAEAGPGDEPPSDGRVRAGRQAVCERLQQALATVRQAQAPAAPSRAAGQAQEPPPIATGDDTRATGAAPVAAKGRPKRRQVPPKPPVASSSDPEAVLTKKGGTYVLGYNGQVAVDGYCGVIVAADVVAKAGDGDLLLPMLGAVHEMAGGLPQQCVADSGYFSAAAITAAEAAGLDLYVPERPPSRQAAGPAQNPYHKAHFRYDAATDSYLCPQGRPLTFVCISHSRGVPIRCYACHQAQDCPARQDHSCTHGYCRSIQVRGQPLLTEAHRRKMATPAARSLLRRRSGLVETIFAIFQEMGLRRFWRRGLANAASEWFLTCAAYNLNKIWRQWWRWTVTGYRVSA
jgi:transposase